ncbi:MAG: DUF3368 domain-containing protein [Pirellulaceae bacterium]|nr:MAG: DUF3368 domain-containing protein [Pirellulaceae bacterium]
MPEGLTVSNSSCLIVLEAVGQLNLLRQLYSRVNVPETVAKEFGSALPAWCEVRAVTNQSLVQTLKLDLGTGEAEAIALSIECSASRLILDDKKARRVARQLNQPVTGTLAILLRAKERGLLSNVRTVLDALVAANFRVSNTLVQEVLREAGE